MADGDDTSKGLGKGPRPIHAPGSVIADHLEEQSLRVIKRDQEIALESLVGRVRSALDRGDLDSLSAEHVSELETELAVILDRLRRGSARALVVTACLIVADRIVGGRARRGRRRVGP